MGLGVRCGEVRSGSILELGCIVDRSLSVETGLLHASMTPSMFSEFATADTEE